MAWTIMSGAILLEVLGTVCLKLADGFTRLGPSLAIIPLYGGSLALLVIALKTLPVSTAYAVWSALGTAIIAVIGILYFREPVSAVKVASLVLVIIGVVGLHLGDKLAETL